MTVRPVIVFVNLPQTVTYLPCGDLSRQVGGAKSAWNDNTSQHAL